MQNNQMNPLEQGAPWLANYGDVPFHLEYPNVSIADAVLKTAEKEKDFPAISFMGKTFSYTVLVEKINQAAAGFVALGVKKGDMVTICMPNVPQAVFCMYALNRIGAVASMIHPLSAVSEIIYYLKEVKSDYLLTLDQFYSKVAEVEKTYPVKKVIITSSSYDLSGRESSRVIVNWSSDVCSSDPGQQVDDITLGPDNVAIFIHLGGGLCAPPFGYYSALPRRKRRR